MRNQKVKELVENDWIWLDEKYEHLVRGFLYVIRSEIDREYWNKNQKEMTSPFENTGSPDFSTDYFTVRSYNWNGNYLPNFDTDELKVFWYKHANRGVEVLVKSEDNVGELLARVLNNSIESIDSFFNKRGG